ncbi:uncharacterized protein LOC124129284 isoform X2 [Haliotis rufescens]|uniref:uncharacterized protein LOC124129284 isoform X2 n=1 Tax=Haliotis rufescens TaxID=6454 RepID=UPI00201E85AE|nr:uncharacterized protein LOC124129284 isoform X2 [Haliotis rufescens]
MWKMMTLSFLICFFVATLIRVQVAADCPACTYDSAPDTTCAKLKTYLDCLETAAGTKEGCTLSAADVTKFTAATCKPDLAPPYTCQKDFWVKDLTGDKECAALKTYIGCLTTHASALVTKPQGRSDSKCTGSPTTTAPGSPTPTPADKKGSGASSLRVYSAIASFLLFVLAAFRL